MDYKITYQNLQELTQSFSEKLSSVKDQDEDIKRRVVLSINHQFNDYFWHKYKHIFMNLDDKIKADVNTIFTFVDIGNGLKVNELAQALDSTSGHLREILFMENDKNSSTWKYNLKENVIKSVK